MKKAAKAPAPLGPGDYVVCYRVPILNQDYLGLGELQRKVADSYPHGCEIWEVLILRTKEVLTLKVWNRDVVLHRSAWPASRVKGKGETSAN